MSTSKSEYLRYLPQILRDAGGEAGFLNGYLKVIEALLSGRDDVPPNLNIRSIEGMIAAVPALFDPALTPMKTSNSGASAESPFLDYLARWVALTFDQNWKIDKRREWLRRIVPLYKRRGTLSGLSEYLAMFIGNQARVEELPGGFIVGNQANATVGLNTFIAGAPAYFFRVRINYGYSPDRFDITEWKNLRRGTRTIVDTEKPAHTYYALHTRTPGIIVGGAKYGGPNSPDPAARGKGRATVGADTLIWQESRQVGTSG